jgi:membrane-associated protease RseP (regulator of RpoE activity)
MKSSVILFLLLCPLILTDPKPALAGGPDDVVVIDADPDGDGWLGVSIQDMTPRLAKSLEVETKEGALVNEVVEDSPAEKAGVREEDVIVEFNGTPVVDADDLATTVRKLDPDSKATLVLMRGKERKSFEVTIGRAPRMRTMAFHHPKPPKAPRVHVWMSHSTLGMEVQDLNEQLGAYFGAPKNEGVLVTSVDEGGAAAKAGLKAGDVVLKVENQVVREEDDIWDEVEEYKEGDKVSLEILRDKSRKTLTLEIEGSDGAFWFGPRSDMDFDFDHESFDDFEKELRLEIEGSEPEIDWFHRQLREISREIREWGKELKEKLRSLEVINS